MPQHRRVVNELQRRKVTVACEPCRRRKARCSGTIPCTGCVRGNLECEIDTNRLPRGRRPAVIKQPHPPSTQGHSSPSEASNFSEAVQVDCGQGQNDLPAISPQDDALFLVEIVATRRRLHEGLSNVAAHLQRSTNISSGLLVHLVELFCTAVNHQQLPILPQEYVVEWLIDRECPPFLLLAISALSLPYSSHHSLKSDWDVDLADRLNQQSRMELQKHSFSKSNLDKIVAMCILALHEINFGNGEQAWCDVGGASSIVELMPAIDDTNSMESVVFSTIKNQLAWIRVCFALGHPNLLPCIHRKPEDKINEEILGADACVAGAVKLILDIAKYTDKHPDLDTMPPWYQQSTFMSLHRQLDRFFIYIAANFHIGAGSPLDGVSSRAEYFYALFVNLVLEHCTMMLTQGVLAQLEEGKKGHWDGAPPSTFIEACALACETSAEKIYEICVILASERLSILPPFLGFCCFQAAMIFIYCLPKKEGRARGEIVAKLKLILAVLGAIKTAYKGASLWVDILVKIQRAQRAMHLDKPSTLQSLDPFHPRCPPIDEWPFIPFADSFRRRPKDSTEPRDESRQKSPDNNAFPKDADSWISSYKTQLKLQVQIIAKDNSTSLQRDGDLAGAEAHGNNGVEQASHESNDESPPQSDGLEQNFTSRISLPPTFPHQVLWGDQEVNSHTNPAYGLEGIVASFYHLAHEAGIPIMSDEEYLRMGSHIADQGELFDEDAFFTFPV